MSSLSIPPPQTLFEAWFHCISCWHQTHCEPFASCSQAQACFTTPNSPNNLKVSITVMVGSGQATEPLLCDNATTCHSWLCSPQGSVWYRGHWTVPSSHKSQESCCSRRGMQFCARPQALQKSKTFKSIFKLPPKSHSFYLIATSKEPQNWSQKALTPSLW